MSPVTATVRVRQRVAAAVAVLLVAAAALLVVGILLERHAESGAKHAVVASTGEQQANHHDESAEGAHAESGAPAGGGEAGKRLTGISVESPWIVAAGAIASVALAVAVWRRPTRPVIAIVVAFTLAALVFDILEISHQVGVGRVGLAALAGVIAALRVATIGGSGYLFRTAKAAT